MLGLYLNRAGFEGVNYRSRIPAKKELSNVVKREYASSGLNHLSNYNKASVSFGCNLDVLILKKMNDKVVKLIEASSPSLTKLRKGALLEELNMQQLLAANEKYNPRENAFLKRPYSPEGTARQTYNRIMGLFACDKTYGDDGKQIILAQNDGLVSELKKAFNNHTGDLFGREHTHSARVLVQESHAHHKDIVTGKNYDDDLYLGLIAGQHNDKTQEYTVTHLAEFPGFEGGEIVQTTFEKFLDKEILNRKTALQISRFVVDRGVIAKNPQMGHALEHLKFNREVDGSFSLNLRRPDDKPDLKLISSLSDCIKGKLSGFNHYGHKH